MTDFVSFGNEDIFAEVISIKAPSLEDDVVSTSSTFDHLEPCVRHYQKELQDMGDMECEIKWDNGLADNIKEMFEKNTPCLITFPDGKMLYSNKMKEPFIGEEREEWSEKLQDFQTVLPITIGFDEPLREMKASEICRKYNSQNCGNCDDLECCDNQKNMKAEINLSPKE